MKVFVLVGILFGLAAFHIKTSFADAGNHQLPTIFGNAKVETENSGYTTDGKELYQGDMILTDEQKEWLEEPEGLRKAISDPSHRWPGAMIPYRISESSENDRGAILRGMEMWTQNSCITFSEVADNYNAPHVVFEKLHGCYSSFGQRYDLIGQRISIGHGCTKAGTVAHEIGHALGFHHEHCRPDRDQYIVILNQNIQSGKMRHFMIERSTNDYDVPYDLGSIMHYGPYVFSVNDKFTIVARDPTKQFIIGKRRELSFADLKLAHLMYNCSSNCGTQRCLNGGYVDQTCMCKCAPGFTGSICENTARHSLELTCGSSVNSPTTIASPNYPGSYPENSNCVWVVTAPFRFKVRVRFHRFQMAERDNWCTHDFLEVRPKDLYDGERFCGTELDKTSLTSNGRTMVLLFSSQTSSPGFQADITFVQ